MYITFGQYKIKKMKKRAKNLLLILGLVTVLTAALIFEVKSQNLQPPCEDEIVVVDGTIMNRNPKAPWNYECMGDFTDCTDVWILGCQED